MSVDESAGSTPEPNDHVQAATRAVHALGFAHQQLCSRYMERCDADQARREALADIAGALLPPSEQDFESDRAESLIEGLLALLDEMRTQEASPPSERSR